MTDTDTLPLDAAGFTRKVRAGMVRTVAEERSEHVFPHREELAYLLDTMTGDGCEAVRRRAFMNALALVAYSGRRPR